MIVLLSGEGLYTMDNSNDVGDSKLQKLNELLNLVGSFVKSNSFLSFITNFNARNLFQKKKPYDFNFC